MADRTRSDGAAGTAARPARRRPVPGRRQLLGAVALVAVGSFMPWVDTAVGNISGYQWSGLWTFYAAMVGLAGALVPIRWLSVAQAGIFAAAAIVLPVIQVGQLMSLVGMAGWRPGPGLVLVVGGGVLAAFATRRMVTGADPA
jgi:hypothetical protein